MAKRRIHAKGPYEYDEKVASEAISPGMLVEQVPGAATLRKHATEGGYAERAFAQEDALQGKTVSDAYSAADLLGYILPSKGACVNALLKTGTAYDIGDELISGSGGLLIKNGDETSGTTIDDVIAVCTEACDLSGSGAVNTLSEVRIL